MNSEADLFFAFAPIIVGKKALCRDAHMYYKDFFNDKGYVVIEPHKKGMDVQREFLNGFYENENEFFLERDSLKDVCTVFLWDG
jgi:hypothetical protein